MAKEKYEDFFGNPIELNKPYMWIKHNDFQSQEVDELANGMCGGQSISYEDYKNELLANGWRHISASDWSDTGFYYESGNGIEYITKRHIFRKKRTYYVLKPNLIF